MLEAFFTPRVLPRLDLVRVLSCCLQPVQCTNYTQTLPNDLQPFLA